MQGPATSNYTWLANWMYAQNIQLWGLADLSGFSTPKDENNQNYPFAISWAIPMNPKIMISIQKGPNQAYADAYAEVNHQINKLSGVLLKVIKAQGYQALALAASDRTDKVNIKGDFPHKTAATRAGLGWIGCHCQLITRQFGSWIRLGTVFTDMILTPGSPIDRSFCGRCTRCVEACPAGALKGTAWYPGLPRKEILDAKICDHWKKKHYFQYHNGHNCGICSAVCPYGLRQLSKKNEIIPFKRVD